MKRLVAVLLCLLAAGLGTAVGFLIASKSVSFHIEVDYDSARCRERVFVGPILVRDQPNKETRLGSVRMPNGSIALHGKEDWRTALIFEGNSKRSSTFDAGMVFYHIKILENLSWKTSTDLALAKQQFLSALSVDSSTAIQVVNSLAEKMRSSDKEEIQPDR